MYKKNLKQKLYFFDILFPEKAKQQWNPAVEVQKIIG